MPPRPTPVQRGPRLGARMQPQPTQLLPPQPVKPPAARPTAPRSVGSKPAPPAPITPAASIHRHMPASKPASAPNSQPPRGCSTPTTRVRTCFLSVWGDRRLWRRAVVAVLPCTATVQTDAKAAECTSGQTKAITGTAVSASCATGTHHTATDVVNERTAYGPQHPVAAHWSWCPIPGDPAYGKATDWAHSACLCASLSSLTAPCTRATVMGCMGSTCAPGTSMANRIRFACISTGRSIWLSAF